MMRLERRMRRTPVLKTRPLRLAGVAVVVGVLVLSTVFQQTAHAVIAYRDYSDADNGSGDTQLSVPMPSSVAQNDVMIAVISVRGGTGTAISTVPSGWTLINANDSGTTLKSATYYKVVGAGEYGPYIWGWSATQRAAGVISAYSGVNTSSPIMVQNSQANASGTTMAAPSVTTTANNAWIVAAYSTAYGTNLTAGSGMTYRDYMGCSGGGVNCTTSGIQDILQVSSGSSGTKTMTAGNAAVNIGHTIALTPEATYTQSVYRWYANANSTTPGSALANESTIANAAAGTAVRLRAQLDIASGALGASQQDFKLQYAPSTSGPWTGVGETTPWWNSSYYRRIKITFNNAQSTDNLQNFPVRVSLDSGIIDYTKTDDQGRDLRFVDADGSTVLNYEREVWNESGTSDVWVNVPQIDAGSTTDYVYLYYNYMGGGATPTDGQNVSGTWNSGYKGVWHSKESSGTSIADSTSNGNTGTLQNGATITSSGKIGNANSFDGTNDVMNAGSGASLDNLYSQGGGGMTVTAWVNSVDSDQWSEIATKAQSAAPSNGWIFEHNDQDDRIYGTFTYNAGASSFYMNSGGVGAYYGMWTYFGMTYDNSELPSGINLYTNGVNDNYNEGGTGTIDSDASYDFTSGCDMPAIDSSECMQGSIDELRVSNVVRSASWIKAEYLSGNNTMNSFGMAETYTGSAGFTWYDNATPSGGATLGSSVLTGTDVLQTYEEGNPTATNPNAVTVGQQAEWDFSLDTTGVTSGTYYFRMVKSNGMPLGAYSVYPAITITSLAPTIDQQTRGGGSVVNGVKGSLTW